MPSVIPIPLPVLVHPSVPAFPALARAHSQYGGIPVPVPLGLFNGCMVIASMMDMDPHTVMATEAKEFFLKMYDAAKGPHDSINPAIADAEPVEIEKLLERLDIAAKTRAKPATSDTDMEAYRRQTETRLVEQTRYIINLEQTLQSVVVRLDKLEAKGVDVSMDRNKLPNESPAPATTADIAKVKMMDTVLTNLVSKVGNIEVRMNTQTAKVSKIEPLEQKVKKTTDELEKTLTSRIENKVTSKIQSLSDRFDNAMEKMEKAKTPGLTSAQLSILSNLTARVDGYQTKADKTNSRIDAVERSFDVINSRFKALVDHTDKTEIKIVGLEDDKRSNKIALKVLQGQLEYLSHKMKTPTCPTSNGSPPSAENGAILGAVHKITKNLDEIIDNQSGVSSAPPKKEDETVEKVA